MKITLVYISGEESLMGDYMPISVLSVLSTMLECLVYNQLYSYLEEIHFSHKGSLILEICRQHNML